MSNLEQRQRTARTVVVGIGAMLVLGWMVMALCVGVSSAWWEGALLTAMPPVFWLLDRWLERRKRRPTPEVKD